jgi:hypothetical protein
MSLVADSKSVSTIRGYVSPIASRHDQFEGHPISVHPLLALWVKGLSCKLGLPWVLVPLWNLEVVIKALQKWPFQPVWLASRKQLTWKTVCLVAVASALCHVSLYIRFSAEEVTLFPDVSFLPKVNTLFHASRPTSSLWLGRQPEGVRLPCVCRILKVYLDRTMSLQAPNTDQLFITYGAKSPASPVSNQRISAWLVEHAAQSQANFRQSGSLGPGVCTLFPPPSPRP